MTPERVTCASAHLPYQRLPFYSLADLVTDYMGRELMDCCLKTQGLIYVTVVMGNLIGFPFWLCKSLSLLNAINLGVSCIASWALVG